MIATRRLPVRLLAAVVIPLVVGGGLIALESWSRTLASESKDDLTVEVFLSRDREQVYLYMEDRRDRAIFDHGNSVTVNVCPYVSGSASLNLTENSAVVRYNGLVYKHTLPSGQ